MSYISNRAQKEREKNSVGDNASTIPVSGTKKAQEPSAPKSYIQQKAAEERTAQQGQSAEQNAVARNLATREAANAKPENLAGTLTSDPAKQESFERMADRLSVQMSAPKQYNAWELPAAQSQARARNDAMQGFINSLDTMDDEVINRAAEQYAREISAPNPFKRNVAAPVSSGDAFKGLNETLSWDLNEQAINDAATTYQTSLARENREAKQAAAEAERQSRMAGYRRIQNAEDFGEKSQFESSYEPLSGASTDEWKRAYINGDPKAISSRDNGPYTDWRYLKQMNDSEVATYNYIYETQGAEASEQYLKDITGDLNARNRQATEEYWSGIAENHPVAGSVFSIAAKPLGAMALPGQVVDYLQDGSIDQNAPYNTGVHAINAIRGTVAKKIEDSLNKKLGEKWGPKGSWAYQLGMSMADSVMNMLPVIATGGASEAAEKMMLGLMGSGAAADTVVSMKDEGYDDNRVMALGLIAGLAEYVTERIGMDSAMEIITRGVSEDTFKKQIIKNLLQQTGSEGLEEGLSDIINWTADSIYSAMTGDPTAFQRSYQAYKSQGMTDGEAMGKAVADRWKEFGMDVAGGALSGLFMGAGGTALNYGGNVLNQVQTIRNTPGAVQGLIDSGLESAPGTKAYEQAVKNRAAIMSGRNLSAAQIIQQATANNQAIAGEELAEDAWNMDGVWDAAVEQLRNRGDRSSTDFGDLQAGSDARNEAGQVIYPQPENITQNGAERPVAVAAARSNVTVDPVVNMRTNPAAVIATINRMGDQLDTSGSINLRQNYDGTRNVSDYVEDFTKVYNAAKEGKEIPKTGLSTVQEFAAKTAGINDAAGYVTEGNNGLQVRQGSEWNDSQDTSGQVRGLAEAAGGNSRGNEGGYVSTRRADRAAASLKAGEKVSPASLGIPNGSTAASIRIVENGSDTEYTKLARETAKRNGLRLTLFVGGDLEINGQKGIRGVIVGDRVFVRADDPDFNADQLMRHEEGHYLIRTGKINFDEVQRRMSILDQEGTIEAVRNYASAYEGSGMTADEIYEEIICDALGEMNIFEDYAGLNQAHGEYISTLKDQASSRSNQARAPTDSGIKFSSKSEALARKDVDWMDDYSSIKEQLEKHAEEINSMDPVAVVEYVHNYKESLVDLMLGELPHIGGKVIKNNRITFEFSENGARSISGHAHGADERAAAIASPYVGKYGKLIAGQVNHEGTGLTTLTFAAPVIINDDKVNVGLVVQFQADGKPRAVNVGLQGGGGFEIKKASQGISSRVTRYEQGTSLPTRDASNNKISPIKETVKELTETMGGTPDTGEGLELKTSLRPSNPQEKQTIDWLNNQDTVTVYRAMQVIDGKLYPPMAARVKDSTGKKSLVEASEIGMWDQAVERPDLIKNGNKFELDKANGSSIQAAYNPYFHTSRSMLNDQFSSAYKRDNIVIVECEVPASELTSGYKAQYAKDAVGEMKWHSGPVSSKLKGEKARRVILSRWVRPVRIVPNAEVAQHVKALLDGENISIPYNTVTPSLRAELEKIGVPVTGDDKPQAKFSMKAPVKDSVGRNLSKEQQDYFKDSKVRDENGNLMVMYHGTPNAGFTAFRSGTYFTQERWYAEGYQKPAASAISRGKTAENPGVYEVYLDIKKPFDTRLPEVRKIWDNEFYRKWGTGTPLQESGLPDWTDGLDLQEFIEDQGYDFDGLILDEGGFPDKNGNVVSRGLSYVTFNPEQVKNVDNKKPTKDPDIRFSMKAPIEQTDRLIAWHNMNESALESALDLGGLAMPSFAVKPANMSHNDYGPISVLAYRESVEPTKSGSQMIFGGDAWTPTFPEVHSKVSISAQKTLYNRISGLLEKAGTTIRALGTALDTDNIEDKLNRWGSFEAAYKDEAALKLAFMTDTHRDVDLPMKGKAYSADADILEKLAPKYGDIWPGDNTDIMQYEPEIRKALYDDAMEKYPDPIESKLKSRNGLYVADVMWGEPISWAKMDNILRDIHYITRNGVQQELDTYELKNALTKAINDQGLQDEYSRWLRNISKDIVEKRGIRNDKDMYTSSGNRRSFEQLHYEYNLENIVKAMKSQAKQGRTTFLSGPGSAKGAALKSYGNIEEVRSDISRVQEQSEETDAAYEAFNQLVQDLSKYIDPSDWLAGSDAIADVLSHTKTEDGIKRYLQREYRYLETQDHKDLDRITRDMLEIVEEANKLPMEYFESKLYREFPLDEAAAIIVPDTTSEDLIQRLKDAWVNVETYKAGDNEDRLRVANSVKGAKFSRRVPASDVKNGVDISGVTVNDVTERLNVSESDAAPAVEAINSFDGVQIEMDLAGLLKKKDVQTAFDAFKRDLIYDGGVSFVGRTFRNASELAVAANIFRDPRFETVRYIFTDAEGKVVMNTGVSSQIPNCSPIFTKPQMFPDIFNKAQDLGARNVYMMHNHPSGDPTPSGADFGAAKYLEEFAAQGHIKMRECIIINHKKGTLFRGDGTVDRFDYSAGEADPLLNVGDTIRGPKDMLKIAESINSESDDVVFIYSNAKGSVTGIQKVAGRYFTGSDGSGQFGKLQKYLHDNGLSFGANSIFAYTKNPSEGLMSVLEGAYMQGFLRDVTGSGEPSLHEQGVFSRGSSDDEYMGQKHRAESRFSRRASNDSIEQLRQSNDELRNTVAQLNKELKAETARANKAESQLKRTEKPTARAEDIRKLAKQYTTGTDADINEAAAKMQALANKIIQGGTEGTLVYDELLDDALEIVRPIVEGTKELMNSQELETINGIRNYFRKGKFHFDNLARYNQAASNIAKAAGKDQTRGEITDYENLRRHNFGRFTLTRDANARAIDDAWMEAQGMFGTEYFPEDITSIPDMIQHISELLDTLGPVYENPYSYEMAEAKSWMASELLNDLIGESVRQAAPTYADRMNQKLERQAYQARERMNEALAKEREKRDEAVQAVKDHYKEMAAAKRTRRLESADRTRLLNIAKRLANKKLPAANRALINQYIGELDLTAKSMTGKTLQKLSGLRDWYEDRKADDPDFISDPNIEKAISRLSKRHISELTIGEVRDLTDVLLNIENELRTEKKLIDSQVKEDLGLAAVKAIADVKNSKGSKGGAIDSYVVTELVTPERELRRLSGYAEGSPLAVAGKELSEGQRKMFDYTRRANNLFRKWIDDKAFAKSIAGEKAQTITITGSSMDGPVEVEITPAMRMSLYLHSLNDQNLKHINNGGITVPDMKLYKKGNIQEAYNKGTTVRLTPSQVREITASMTVEERAFANAAHDYFNGMSRDAINETSEKLKGYSLAGVEDYFPIQTDTSFLAKDFDSIKQDGTIEGMGFTKERVNASNPIMLYDMNDVLTRSIKQHSKYVGLAIPVRNFNKLWNARTGGYDAEGNWNSYGNTVQKEVSKKWGGNATNYVERMMKGLNNSSSLHEKMGDLLSKTRSHYAGAVLSMNAGVAIKQAASYPTAAAVVGWKPLLQALNDPLNKKVNLDTVAKYTPLLWYRSQGFSSQELGDIASRGQQLPKFLNWIQGMDVWTTTKLWSAAEYYVRDNFKNLDRGSDAYYKQVAEIYNRIIEETQPNYTTMQRPQILRSENELTKTLNMFKTQPFQNFNILYDAFGELGAKRTAYRNTGSAEAKAAFQEAKKGAARAVSSQLISAVVFALMQFAWDALRGRDDKYKDKEGEADFAAWMKGMGLNVLSNGFGMLPYGGFLLEVAESTTDKILKELDKDPFFDATYYGLEASPLEAINDVTENSIKAIVQTAGMVNQMVNDKDVNFETYGRTIYSTIENWAQFLGQPVANVRKTAEAVAYQTLKAGMGPYVGRYYSTRITSDPAKYPSDYYDLLYRAYKNDQKAYKEIYDLLVSDKGFGGNAGGEVFTDEKIRTNMEKRMKEAEGVKKVEELKQRYLSPSEQKVYSVYEKNLHGSDIWDQAPEKYQKQVMDSAYDLAVGNKTGLKLKEKISGGKSVGLTESQYLLYQLALSVVDQPTESGKLGSYTSGEKDAALDLINFDAAVEEYLRYNLYGTDSEKKKYGYE